MVTVRHNIGDGNIKIGYGKSFGSFGEILQGSSSNHSDFLITLPIDLWSISSITSIKRNGPLVINCQYNKSKKLAFKILNHINIYDGYELNISFNRNIPIGKGLSSSTADMISTARALQEIFGIILSTSYISKIFSEIEPHDALHFKSSVLYNQITGKLINNYNYIPNFAIIYFDKGGTVDTVKKRSSKKLKIPFSHYDELILKSETAFKNKDDSEIAKIATQSAILYSKQNQDPVLDKALVNFKKFDSIGLINTHSGTCIGFIYDKNIDEYMIFEKINIISSFFNLPTNFVKTLTLVQ